MQMYSTAKEPEPGVPFWKLLPTSLLQSLAVADLFQGSWIEPPLISRRSYNVLYHQILSFLAERNGVRAFELVRFFANSGVFPDVTASDFEILLRHLVKLDHLQQVENSELLVGLEGEKVLRSRDFYAVFNSPPEWEVRHATQPIGKVVPNYLQPGDELLLGGRMWHVIEVIPQKKQVQVEPASSAKDTHFTGPKIPRDFHHRVARRMRELLFRHEMPTFLDEAGNKALQDARIIASHHELNKRFAYPHEDHVVILPWAGERARAALWKMFLVKDCDPSPAGFAIALKAIPTLARLKEVVTDLLNDPPEAEELITEGQVTLKFDEYIPSSLLRQREIHEQLDMETAQIVLREIRDSLIETERLLA